MQKQKLIIGYYEKNQKIVGIALFEGNLINAIKLQDNLSNDGEFFPVFKITAINEKDFTELELKYEKIVTF